MLSDETATSKNWKNIITWFYKYLKNKKNEVNKSMINITKKKIQLDHPLLR